MDANESLTVEDLTVLSFAFVNASDVISDVVSSVETPSIVTSLVGSLVMVFLVVTAPEVDSVALSDGVTPLVDTMTPSIVTESDIVDG